MNTFLIAVLVIIGVVLLVIELFLIPGIGFAGVAGVSMMVAGVVCSYAYLGATAGHITFLSTIILSGVAIYVFVRSKALDKMALKENIDSKVDLIKGTNVTVGDTGITISRLAPMGKVRVNDVDVEAKSNDSFIDQGTKIEIVALEGNTVIVKTIA